MKLPAWSMLLVCVLVENPLIAAPKGRFSNYEVRSIRQKTFQKKNTLELGGSTSAIMNQPFIYTFLASGILSYHLSESWGLQVEGAYGMSVDKDDKRLLKDEFDISTEILRTESLLNAKIMWTPIYGKILMDSGKLMYFDTYLNAGAGFTGVRYEYDNCQDPADVSPKFRDRVPEKPQPKSKQYPTVLAGVGQRLFLDKESAASLGVSFQQFRFNRADGSCNPSVAVDENKAHNNILLILGYSLFF
jgi:outer membrane beta-barrel protein